MTAVLNIHMLQFNLIIGTIIRFSKAIRALTIQLLRSR